MRTVFDSLLAVGCSRLVRKLAGHLSCPTVAGPQTYHHQAQSPSPMRQRLTYGCFGTRGLYQRRERGGWICCDCRRLHNTLTRVVGPRPRGWTALPALTAASCDCWCCALQPPSFGLGLGLGGGLFSLLGRCVWSAGHDTPAAPRLCACSLRLCCVFPHAVCSMSCCLCRGLGAPQGLGGSHGAAPRQSRRYDAFFTLSFRCLSPQPSSHTRRHMPHPHY